MKKNMRMACEQRLPDGSYLSHVYPSERDWRHKTNGIAVRVIDYRLEGIEGAEPIYRLRPLFSIQTRPRPANWPPSIMSAGRSRPPSTN